MVQMFARRRFVVYALIGATLLAASAYFAVQSYRETRLLLAFDAERQVLLKSWQMERPLPKPFVGFGFEPKLTKVDLRWSASEYPFPPTKHVEIRSGGGGEFDNELPGTPLVNFDPQRINDPVDIPAETLAGQLMQAMRAGLPTNYETVIESEYESTSADVAELVSSSVSPSGHSGVWIAVRLDLVDRQVRVRHVLCERFPGKVDPRSIPDALGVSERKPPVSSAQSASPTLP